MFSRNNRRHGFRYGFWVSQRLAKAIGVLLLVVIVAVLACMLSPKAAHAADSPEEQPVLTASSSVAYDQNAVYQRKIVISYGEKSRKITLSARYGSTGQWRKYVVAKYNRANIPSYNTPTGLRAAEKLQALLAKAADMSWGATFKPFKKTKRTVIWDIQFSHWIRVNGKLTKYTLAVGCSVKVHQTKSGKLNTTYYVGSAPVKRDSILTLLMKQSTTVSATGMGKFVPNVR